MWREDADVDEFDVDDDDELWIEQEERHEELLEAADEEREATEELLSEGTFLDAVEEGEDTAGDREEELDDRADLVEFTVGDGSDADAEYEEHAKPYEPEDDDDAAESMREFFDAWEDEDEDTGPLNQL